MTLKSLYAHSSVKITENYMGDFDTATNDKALMNIFEEKGAPKSIDEMLKNITPEQEEAIRQILKK